MLTVACNFLLCTIIGQHWGVNVAKLYGYKLCGFQPTCLQFRYDCLAGTMSSLFRYKITVINWQTRVENELIVDVLLDYKLYFRILYYVIVLV